MSKLVKPFDLIEKLEAIFSKRKIIFKEPDYDGFMILRFLTTDPDYADIARAMSYYMLETRVSTKMVVLFLQRLLPKGGFRKSRVSLKKNSRDHERAIIFLKQLFFCTTSQAYQIKKILDDQNIDLNKIFGIQTKTTKVRGAR